ncbi:kinase A anchor protein [Dipodascopsis tothii]|uniref:kinase A anchor protein n=1 Tax=Dipodascopsis tothii TaxID=44089 RepID=UPI0034CD344E
MPAAQRLTHFLSIPIPVAVRQRIGQLHAAFTSAGIPAAAVRPVATLHLTIAVMALESAERLAEARRTLAELDAGRESILGLEAPVLTLRGLACLGPAARARVVYAVPVGPDVARLQAMAESVKAFFDARGLVADSRPVLLHVTVANSVYVRGRGRGGRPAMDVRGLLEGMNDYELLPASRLDRIELCKMGELPDGRGYAVEEAIGL